MRPHYPAISTVSAFLISVALFALAGCSGSSELPTATVTGTVTYKGEPLDEGEVQLYFQGGGAGATAPIDANGRFKIDNPIPVGIYAACVTPPVEHPNPDAPPSKPKVYPNIPKKARDLKTSGLTVPLNKGKNDVKIELKD